MWVNRIKKALKLADKMYELTPYVCDEKFQKAREKYWQERIKINENKQRGR